MYLICSYSTFELGPGSLVCSTGASAHGSRLTMATAATDWLVLAVGFPLATLLAVVVLLVLLLLLLLLLLCVADEGDADGDVSMKLYSLVISKRMVQSGSCGLRPRSRVSLAPCKFFSSFVCIRFAYAVREAGFVSEREREKHSCLFALAHTF